MAQLPDDASCGAICRALLRNLMADGTRAQLLIEWQETAQSGAAPAVSTSSLLTAGRSQMAEAAPQV